MEFVTVAQVGEIPEGEGRAFEVGEKTVAVFHVGGKYYAIDDMCPHMGSSLAPGHVENCAVSCLWHGWRFDIRDGTWCDNPRIKIDSFTVRLDGNDIQVGTEPNPKQSDSDRVTDGDANPS